MAATLNDRAADGLGADAAHLPGTGLAAVAKDKPRGQTPRAAAALRKASGAAGGGGAADSRRRRATFDEAAETSRGLSSAAAAAAGGEQQQQPSFSSKLTSVEAQRIMSVLQDVQRKVMLIGILPRTIDGRVNSTFGRENTMLLQEYRMLENKVASMEFAKESRDRVTQKDSWKAEYKEAVTRLRSATRSVMRAFVRNPVLTEKLRSLWESQPGGGLNQKLAAVAAFELAVQEIKALAHERLRTTVEEEKSRQDQLSLVITKEQKTTAEVRSLQEELARARAEKATEIMRKDEVIRRLKDELRDIKTQAEQTTSKLESRSKQKKDTELQQFRDKEAALRSDIVALRQSLMESRQLQLDEERPLRKRKYKVETEVDNWIHKYDQDMEEKQAELDEEMRTFQAERAQLEELQRRHDELQVAFDRISREKAEKEKAATDREAAAALRSAAARRLQAVWRGWRCRRDLAKSKENRDGTAKLKKAEKGGKKKKK